MKTPPKRTNGYPYIIWIFAAWLSFALSFMLSVYISDRLLTKWVGNFIEVGGQVHVTGDYMFMYGLLPRFGLCMGLIQVWLLLEPAGLVVPDHSPGLVAGLPGLEPVLQPGWGYCPASIIVVWAAVRGFSGFADWAGTVAAAPLPGAGSRLVDPGECAGLRPGRVDVVEPLQHFSIFGGSLTAQLAHCVGFVAFPAPAAGRPGSRGKRRTFCCLKRLKTNLDDTALEDIH